MIITISVNIVDKGTVSSAYRSNQISSIESKKIVKNSNANNDKYVPNFTESEKTINYYSSNNNSDVTGPNHLKIIPVSGVIYKNVGNQKTGNENYKNQKGRMTYKEYLLLRKKYMDTDINNESSIHNNTMFNIYPKNEEEKRQPVPVVKRVEEKEKENINNKIRSKSKVEKLRNFYWGEKENKFDSKNNEEAKGCKTLYNTNFDENGNEVLNENLFKNRQVEYKTMRKTYTGKFLPNRGKVRNDIKRETMYNFNSNYNKNNGLEFNNKAHKSYYGGFRKNNDKNMFNKK